MKRLFALLAFAMIASSPPVLAEPFASYDNFATGNLDPVLWPDHERARYVNNNKLFLAQREWGATNSDSGITFFSWSENFPDPAAVTQMRATVKVNSMEANSCASNATPGQSRARIIGAFFNTGVPTPGSEVGDVIAQVSVRRDSNSPDAPGVLQVAGVVSLCNSSDCSASTTLGSVPLGTVTIGQAASVQLRWVQAQKTFYFNRDGNTFSGTVGYSQADTAAPGVPIKQLSTRLGVPSCQSAPRVYGLVEASFDNVGVNASAVPVK